MANVYDIGDIVRVSVEFKNIAGTLTDPTTVTLRYRDPSGVMTDWTVTSGQIVKDGTGLYHADLSPTAAGIWTYRFIGVGNLQAAEEGTFLVKPELS